ncbi:MAG: peptide deformylase [Holosporales bacterium]|jgi:peptide deformylase|nr:peptide deformylase [Holosporales bacterium]
MKWAQALVCCLLAGSEVVGMRICIYPDPILGEKAQLVTEASEDIRDILERMKEVMLKANGIGIAAPQVGISKRLVVVYNEVIQRVVIGSGDRQGAVDDRPIEPIFYKMINPEITGRSSNCALSTEGCLSLPGVFCEIERANSVSVEFLDEQGKKQTVEATGLLAACFQHEIDHLDGMLFIDRIGDLQKREQVLIEYYERK